MARASKPKFLEGYDWIHFQQEYQNTDDRSCAIIFAAYLDNCLEETLLRVTKHPDDCRKKLLTDTAPFGTFSTKIDVLWVFGHLLEETYKDLHFIRKIRNKFAHDMAISSFSHEPIRSWCHELSMPRLRSEAQTYKQLYDDPRKLFIVSGALCEGELKRASEA